ncbi:hypothetical protein FQR65_LT17578 [Abscondita terminalis]|nr:hypothetical protein FQR65_LT17578 [Abscondita terminalis]
MIKQREEGWEMDVDAMIDIVKKYDDEPVTEVHITGGVVPKQKLEFYADFFRKCKAHRPELHIKALTPVEYYYIFKKAKLSHFDGMKYLKEAGLDSMPGGGAEIFHPEIREQIAHDKCTAEQWLDIHEQAHLLGIRIPMANPAVWHIEKFWHRVDHMERLRQLQDKTGGFQTFIPLKFRNKENQMSDVDEVSVIEDLRNYAVARIYMDNFPHIKAYWAMISRDTAQMSLSFGVDDIDGTLDDTTKIYSMAGAEEQTPAMSTQTTGRTDQECRTPSNRTGYAISLALFIEQGLDWEQLIGLDEISWGIYEGREQTPDIMSGFEKVIQAWRSGELDLNIEDGENRLISWWSVRRKLSHICWISRKKRLFWSVCTDVLAYSDVCPYRYGYQISSILLDPQSRTSNGLARILLKYHWKRDVEIITEGEADAYVLIGDRTFGKKGTVPYVYDMGLEWKNFTGLPFAFALWVSNKKLSKSFVEEFNEALKYGVEHAEDVIAGLPVYEGMDYRTIPDAKSGFSFNRC